MTKKNPEAKWFGLRRVAPEEKTGLVRDVFSSVACRYDLMNDLMSGGLHRLWKDALIRRMNPKAGMTLLDLAGGTGDIALRLHRRTEGKAAIIVCDVNPEMLKQGRRKVLDHGVVSGITFVEGNAEDLPFKDRSMDMVSIAFGLRNVTRIDTALSEAVRVLKKGGRFFCMEFSPGVAPFLKPVYEKYCATVLPFLGEHVAHDRAAYQYLAESIRKFPPQKRLAERMEKAGFTSVKWTNLTGGIAVIHEGYKV
ncbi:MAG: bifunctional demethylmenaquinone methyltransferase/2-methoxy-6-polyprenyl-1,4-benzoquinol methylase UbiE [Bdellovibrionales bacterium]